MSTDQKKLRWGILSAANITNQVLPRMAQANNAEIVAIASRSKDRAEKAAKEKNIPKAYGSYEELLADPEIDAVYNPLPNTLHDEWTRRAADQGKHTLCEKPLCPTAAEAQSLIDYCHSKGVKLLDGFMWPHHPRTAAIRQLLDEGEIGDILHVTGSFSFRMEPLDPSNIRLQKDLAGGSLLDVGCYPVYGIRWAMGAEPVRAYASARIEYEVDVAMNGILEFADGRSATFDCAFTLPYRAWLEISGTNGSIWIPNMWQPKERANYIIFREGKEPEERAIEGEHHIVHMVQNFGDAILNDAPMKPDPQEAVKTLKVMDALAQSVQKKVPVAIDG